MAGKYQNVNKRKKEHGRKFPKTGKWIIVLGILLIGGLAAANFVKEPAVVSEQGRPEQNQPEQDQLEQTLPLQEQYQEIDLGQGLVIEQIGSYTGMYVEDGSNEVVSGVMMATLTNNSDQDLEYAQITVYGEAENAQFAVTALPRGKTVVLLEKERKPYDADTAYDRATMDLAAFFSTPLSVMEETFLIQGLDGALNVTNISDEDITGDIVICYKNTGGNYLYGGIAYRVKIEGGLKAGEIRQIMTEHFAGEGSAVIYVNVVETA